MSRCRNIDSIKGLLILTVVVGHAEIGVVHDIIFLFHMPLCFMISGYLLSRNNVRNIDYIIRKIRRLMMPYGVYSLVDFLFVKRIYSFKGALRALWGGRAFSGVYWYITAYLFAILCFSICLNYFSDKKVKSIILFGGV